MESSHNNLISKEINEKLNALEMRIERIEASLKSRSLMEAEYVEIKPLKKLKKISDDSLLESKIGESGLAWLGNIVLFFGIAFLIEQIQKSGYQLISPLLGYAAVAGIFFLSHYLRNNLPGMSSIFNLNAYLLLYYVTLRLHFFSFNPVVVNKSIGLLLLLFVVSIQIFIAVKNKQKLLAGISFILINVTAVVSDSTHFMLLMVVISAIISIVFLYRLHWIGLTYLSIILAYLVYLLWLMNNPTLGHEIKALTIHHYGYIYLFFIGAIFSLVPLVNDTKTFSAGAIIGTVVLNSIGFSLILLLIVLSFFQNNYVIMVGAVSAFCLLYSVILQLRSSWKITAALFALYGFITLSVSLYGIYGFPKVYFMLALQSLLVVTMAIWFRSKFIVIMNTMLFIILLVFYLSTSSLFLNGANISFSLAALITARILNWKKDWLTIKNDFIRNVYLLTAFLMVLVTLYHLVPDRYITLSWTIAAVTYFLLSLILKNVKYRYLALGTMLAATFNLFIFDLANIELVFRIIAFMFLALISIGLSIYYTRRSKRRMETNE